MVASLKGHDEVVEALLKAGATVDMQGKVLLYWTLIFISCLLPVWIFTHAPFNACGTDIDQLVLEYHLGPYCIFNSAILNSSTYYLWLSALVNSLRDTDLDRSCYEN